MDRGIIIFLTLFLLSCADDRRQPQEADRGDRFGTKREQLEKSVGVHPYHLLKYRKYDFDTEGQWDSLHGIHHHLKHWGGFERDEDWKVFGWHLYAMGSAWKSYNFDLLWALAYFSYEVDPETGGPLQIHQWKTTDLHDSAAEAGCKVLLTVNLFGRDHTAKFLENRRAWSNLAGQLNRLLEEKNGAGLVLDFEGVHSEKRALFSSFVNYLSDKLRQQDPEYLFAYALPAIDHQNVVDIGAIQDSVDFFILMGYDYHGPFSRVAGPVAPLQPSKTWGGESISVSVKKYLSEGLAKEKLIVGLPYYGADWITYSSELPSTSERYISHLRYELVHSKYMDSLGVSFSLDTASTSMYAAFRDPKEGIRQIWYDDSLSLSYKYAWIKEQELAGVGIWALGYDHGYHSLWKALALQFGQKQ